jgi:hypothetical protein
MHVSKNLFIIPLAYAYKQTAYFQCKQAIKSFLLPKAAIRHSFEEKLYITWDLALLGTVKQ